MTTANSQQTQISKLFQAMFNAAPGAVLMDIIIEYLTVTNASMTDLANTLARTSVFTSPFSYPSTITNSEFTEQFITNLVGDTVSSTTHNSVVSYIADFLDAGILTRGQVMLLVSNALATATNSPEWAVAAAQFNNRVEVANYYSVDRAGEATDLGTLRAVTADVTETAASVTAGKAVLDSPITGNCSHISGATIFTDLNGNGFLDLTEPHTTTNINGQFTLPVGSFGRLVASGGYDVTTDLPFLGTFTAPPGSTTINPLTTLVQTLIDRGVQPSLARAWVSSSLGLPANIDLTTFAPLNEISGANADAALQILAASVQANNLFYLTASALTNADVTLDMKTAFAQVVSALADHITSATSVLDLTDATLLREDIVASAAHDPAMIASMAGLNTDLSLLVADNNSTIAQILASGGTPETIMTQILQVARIVQGRESTDLGLDIHTHAGTGLANILSIYTGSAFDTFVSQAHIGDVNGDGTIDQPIPLTDPPPAGDDTIAPTLSSNTPADNAIGILVGSNLILTFSETIQPGAGIIVLKKTSANSVIETFNLATGFGSAGGTVTTLGTEVTINPYASLAANTEYYLTIGSTAVKDLTGNPFAGSSSTTALSFTTNTDGIAPTLSSSTPTDNATAVGLSDSLVLTFSENVTAGSGNILIKKLSDGSTVETISVNDAQVTFNGTTGVTINPTANLTNGTTYFVTMDSGVILDTTGNPYAGIFGATTLNFTTVDTTPPMLSSSTPADNATGILVGNNLVLTFNETITLGLGDIVLKKTSDNSVIETFNAATGTGSAGGTVTASGTGVTINPFANLASGTEYYVTVAATAVKDITGNFYAGISSTTALSFTTGADGTAPTLSSSTPADNATAIAVNANIMLTFSENVAAGTGNFLIKKVSDNSTVATISVNDAQVTFNGTTGVTINPTANLIAATAYYVTMASGVVTDMSGNPYAGISLASTLNFTTAAAADIAPPTLSSSTPADNATGIGVGNNLVLTFNETITLGTGNIVLKKTSDNSVIETFNVATGTGSAGGTVTAGGTGVTINPSADLAAGIEYYLTVAATAVQDTAGNPYAGIISTTALSFTTSAAGSNIALAVVGAETINGTGGNDTITGTYTDGGTGTFNNTDVIAGNGGVDTLSITIGAVAITPADSYWSGVTGIEKISLDSTGNGAQTLTTGAAFNTAFTAAGVDLTMQTLLGAINLDMATVPFTGAATITTTTIGAGAHTITTGSGAATVLATAIAAGSQTIKGAGLTTVNATINDAGDQTIGDAGGNGVNLVTVNATIIGVGAQTITSTSASNVTIIAAAGSGAQTIVTGSGNDNITLTTAAGQNTTITTNAGNDTIVASLGTDLITGGLGADTMTGGGGADTFAFGANGSVIGTSMDVITDFNANVADILSFAGNTTVTADLTALVAGSGPGSNVQTSAGGLVTFAGADNTLGLKVAAIQADTELDAIGSVAMFVDGANTYVYYAGTAIGNLDDQLIQLSGITTLSTISGGGTTTIA
ncbi:MAG: Ig-like domain-containing protein [Desulfurivibrionaceae bacterium]|jgi:methionine-rich copper-binding protein CopC